MKTRNVYLMLLLAVPFLSSAQIFNSVALPATLLAQSPEKSSNVGRIDKNVLANSGLSIVMPNFDFDFNFYIIDFEVSIVNHGFVESERWKSSGVKPAKNYAAFNDAQKRLLYRVKRGDRVTIENIRVRGDDGFERVINPITLKIM